MHDTFLTFVSIEPLLPLDRGPAELEGVATKHPRNTPLPASFSVAEESSAPQPEESRDETLPRTSPPRSPPAAADSFLSRRSRLPMQGNRFSVAKTSRFMVMLSGLVKGGHISAEERGTLKELLLMEDVVVFGAFEAHDLSPDLEDLIDTLQRYLTRRRHLANQ